MLLAKTKCSACEGDLQPLSKKEALEYLKQLEGWHISEDIKVLYTEYTMKDFMSAVALINRIAGVAEEEGHHPDIHLTGYRKLILTLSTHAIEALSVNDFILAAKISRLPKRLKSA